VTPTLGISFRRKVFAMKNNTSSESEKSKFLDLSPNDFEENSPLQQKFAPIKVIAAMLYPTKDAARQRFLVSVGFRAAGVLAEKSGGLNISTSAASLLGEIGDIYEMIDQATQPVIYGVRGLADGPNLTAGTISGRILLAVLALNDKDPAHATLDKAREEVSRQIREAWKNPQPAKKARPQDLKKHWSSYKSVAHLWAAYLFWKEAASHGDGQAMGMETNGVVPSGSQQLMAFLALAETIRERGERIKHKNAPHPILKPNEMWRLPPSLANLRLPELGANS
jgi:hypothetical protein